MANSRRPTDAIVVHPDYVAEMTELSALADALADRLSQFEYGAADNRDNEVRDWAHDLADQVYRVRNGLRAAIRLAS